MQKLVVRPRHLIVVGILVLAFSTAFIMRSQPMEFGFELHEFDPFFNYRATEYMLENGLDAYYDWNDQLSWYPSGRDVSSNSQVILHQTAAATYMLFGGGAPLYDFTIIFPIVIGSFTVVSMFALVRVIGGTTAGLISAMLMAISLPIILRGMAGWFKSEPLGIFYAITGVYLFLSGIKSDNRPVAAAKLLGGAILISFSLSAWGGSQFFILPIGIFIMCLPFLRRDHSFLLWAVPLFSISLLAISMLFERPGIDFVTGLGGVAIIGPTIFLVACHFVRSMSGEGRARRNCALLLIGILVGGIGAVAAASEMGWVSVPSFRYLNAINPFLTAADTLVESVSEHQSVSVQQSFFFHSILMIFAGVGAWLLLDRRAGRFHHIPPEMVAFALITCMFGVYISSSFVRLEVFGSIAVIILSSLGISILARRFMTDHSRSRAPMPVRAGLVAGITILLVMPIVIPDINTIQVTRGPPSILNGASAYSVVSHDWLDTYDWIRNNTPPDAVVASWWDYGYWTQTLGERASIADNATIDSDRIKEIATMFISEPDDAYAKLLDLHADYIMIFVMAERLPTDRGPMYILGGGGDESKKHWFIRIAGESVSTYMLADGTSGNDHFWDNTMLGMMMPFSPVLYVDAGSGAQFTEYIPGSIPLYIQDIKYPADGQGPLRLAYASPSFENHEEQIVFGIFVYEVNDSYTPSG